MRMLQFIGALKLGCEFRLATIAIIASLLFFSIGHGALPVDISFIVIDLKFNDSDGVKICEVQQGIGSVFHGSAFFHKREGVVAENFCRVLSKYSTRFWFCKDGISKEFIPVFEALPEWHGFRSYRSLTKSKTFIGKYKKRVINDRNIRDYHGVMIAHFRYLRAEQIEKFKGIIVANAAFTPFFGSGLCTDKLLMSQLLQENAATQELKPMWALYEKGYSKELVDIIHHQFLSEYLVIKPKAGSRGRGVIILHRNELERTLKYIFSNDPKLKNDPDKSYHYWATDVQTHFLLEAFYPSNPVRAPHLGGGNYDGTIRLPVLLIYDAGKVEINFFDSYWKLPAKSLDEEGTLTEKHKSFSRSPKHYTPIDPETLRIIENQLKPAFEVLYRDLCSRSSIETL